MSDEPATRPQLPEPLRQLEAASRLLLRRGLRVMEVAVGHMIKDDGWAMASHLALSALMALFPFLIFVAALAGFIGEAQLADQVTDLLFQAWPDDIAAPLAEEVHQVLTVPRSGVLTLSVLITIYLASNGVEAVRMGLNRAYRATDRRSILRLRAQSVLFVFLGAVASLALAVLGVFGPLLWTVLERHVPELDQFRGNFTLFRYGVVGTLLTAGLIAAHVWLPGERPRAVRLWPGIAATLVLWWLTTTIFAGYLENFANYASTYAGLASVVAAIFYLYLMGVILIFGGEFNAALATVGDEIASERRPAAPASDPGPG